MPPFIMHIYAVFSSDKYFFWNDLEVPQMSIYFKELLFTLTLIFFPMGCVTYHRTNMNLDYLLNNFFLPKFQSSKTIDFPDIIVERRNLNEKSIEIW